jgi:hypothetical protein
MKKLLFLISSLFISNLGFSQPEQFVSLNAATDGTFNQYVTLPNSSIFTQNSFTVEAWVYIPSTTSMNNIFVFETISNDPTEGGFYLRVGFNKKIASAVYGVGGGYVSCNGLTEIQFDTWNHIAMTYDGSTTYIEVFLNGVSDGNNINPGVNHTNNTANVYVGARGSDQSLLTNSYIDEVRYWSTVRTENEILNGMNDCFDGSQSNLEFHLPFDNYTFDQSTYTVYFHNTISSLAGVYTDAGFCSATEFFNGAVCCGWSPQVERDEHTLIFPLENASYQWFDCDNNNPISGETMQTFEPTSAGTYYCEVNVGNCINETPCAIVDPSVESPYITGKDFNGVDQEIFIENQLDVTTAFTFEGWIRPKKLAYSRIFSRYTGSGLPEGTVILDTYGGSPSTDNGKGLRFLVVDGATYSITIDNVLSLNEWQHVAVSFDNGTVKMYVNGTLVKSDIMAISSIPSSTTDWVLGGDEGATGIALFHGHMSDVRVWETVKTAQEIVDLQDACLEGTEQGLILWYDFDNVSGNEIIDASTTENNGLLLGTSTITNYDGPKSCAVIDDSGIENKSFSNLLVYPNPTEDMVMIQTTAAIENITLYSLAGTELFNTHSKSISLSNLSAGAYVIWVNTNQGTYKNLIIKK